MVVGWRRRLEGNALACDRVHEKRGDRGLVGQFLSGGAAAGWRPSKIRGGGRCFVGRGREKAEQHKEAGGHASLYRICHSMGMQDAWTAHSPVRSPFSADTSCSSDDSSRIWHMLLLIGSILLAGLHTKEKRGG